MSALLVGLCFKADIGTPVETLICIRLADAADNDGTRIYPANETVARECKTSVRTVKRTKRLFEAKGLLRVTKEGGHGPRSPTHYALNVELLNQLCDGSTSLKALPDVVPEGAKAGSSATDKGDTVSPLESEEGGQESPIRVTPETDKGDTPYPQTIQNRPEPCSQARAPDDDTRPDDDRLRLILLGAAGPAARTGAKALGSVAVIRKWLDQGANLDRDILPAIRQKAATMQPGTLRSWKFMDGPIYDWMQNRRAKPDAGPAAASKPRNPTTLQPRQWRGWVIRWIDGGRWYAEKGPEPGEPGCLVPDEVIVDVLNVKGVDAVERRKGRPA